MNRRAKKGFTLAELLIVVAIVAVLSAIAFPIFSQHLNEARLAVDLAHEREAKTYAGVIDQGGILEFGSIKISKSAYYDDKGIAHATTDRSVFFFLKDGTLSVDSISPQKPDVSTFYVAQGDGNGHQRGDYLTLRVERKNGVSCIVEWYSNSVWVPPTTP